MLVIRPVTFTPSMLISTNAVETYPSWSSSTSYGLGDKVVYSGAIYESLITSNLNNQPDTSITKWLNIAPSNALAMFDGQVSSQTVCNSTIEVIVRPGSSYNSISLFNLNATTVRVQVYDAPGGNVIYDKTEILDTALIVDWYTYFFEPTVFKNEVNFVGFGVYSGGEFKITITGGTETKCGVVVFGNLIELGKVAYGATVGIRDYSIKTTDEFGNTSFVKRAYSKYMEPSIYVDNARLNYVDKVLTDIRATPTAWIGSNDPTYQSALSVYGYYKDYNIEISYPTFSMMKLQIEGLT